MITVALTGGMGCGKSTAARFFVEEGFRSLDADGIVHELLARDADVREAVVGRFGPEILDASGAIDRRRLGRRAFADPRALRELEAILHPKVRMTWMTAIETHSDSDWIVQIPLLFEKKLEQFFDFTVCVGTSGAIQRRRLLERGLPDHEVRQRISRQLPIEEKTEKADFFLLNDGSLHFLKKQVRCLCGRLTGRKRGSGMPL